MLFWILSALLNILLVCLVGYVLSRFSRSLQAEWFPRFEEIARTVQQSEKLLKQVLEAAQWTQTQLTTDSGLSLRDAVNRIDASTKEQHAAAEFLKDGVRSDRHKAEQDREQLQRLLVELFRLTIKVEEALKTINRVEMAATGVADDLAAAHARADSITEGDHGAAADAASRQTPKEKVINEEREEGGGAND